MECSEIKYGTYDCAYNIQTPWISDDEIAHYIAIDKCLLPEILKLWEMGIRTTGCCCGHGDISKAFISVPADFIPKMKEIGYSCRPNDEDSFIPMIEIDYVNTL